MVRRRFFFFFWVLGSGSEQNVPSLILNKMNENVSPKVVAHFPAESLSHKMCATISLTILRRKYTTTLGSLFYFLTMVQAKCVITFATFDTVYEGKK